MDALDIKKYVKELLVSNQGVIIPDFGGFVSEYEPAAFDVNENKFIPPSKRIIFKQEYSYSDNLLITFISEKEKINKEKSTKQIKEFADDLKLKLKNSEKVSFPEIGILTQNSKGQISFKQEKETNLLSDSFGLQSVQSKPIVNQQKEVKSPTPIKSRKSYKKPIIISSSIVVFLCLVALSWFFTNGFTDFNILSSNDISPIEITNSKTAERNLDSIAQADSTKALINQSIDENTDKKDALFYSKPDEEKQEAEPKSEYSKFHIIAGSFKRIENAEKFAEGIRAKGYNTEIIESSENLIRISIYTFTDETLALKELYKLREKADLKSVWILKVI
ncbi:MAG: SPOR domain-containing protein [Bacteroidales bacterium]|nr:SPOR domain-containing protein [Bacteroidales bacterium]